MKLQIRHDQMEEIQGLHSEYPYAFHRVDMAVTAVPWHWHEAVEFGYVSSGRLQVSTAGQTQCFEKGEGFFINSNTLTAMADTENCILESHLFHPVFLSGHFKSVFETKYLNPVIQNRNLELLPIRGNSPEEKQLLTKLRQLAKLQEERDSEFPTRNILSDIWLLLMGILRKIQVSGGNAGNQDRILSMLAFIHENYRERITLEEIADAAAISTRECLRCFRVSVKQSPMEYLIGYRLRMAKKLLETTDMPVTEVALNCGFNSPSYFTKQFRENFGITPKACRKEK